MMVNEEPLKLITGRVIDKITKYNVFRIPVGVSSQHVHVTSEDSETLFEKGHQLTKKNDSEQPGQYACNEIVTVREPRGEFGRVRTLGPAGEQSQIEASKTGSFRLGAKAPIRESGGLTEMPGLEMVGPKGTVWLPRGTIVTLHRIHVMPQQVEAIGAWDKGIVEVEIPGEGHGIPGDVPIRVSEQSELEIYVDVDEVNACMLKNNDYVIIR